MQIIKDGKIVEDNCLHLDDDAVVVDKRFTVSFTRWQAEKGTLKNHKSGLGLRLMGDDALEDIVADLTHFSLIVLNFPVFTDGRCYSFARLLRDRYGYEGEIRAQGDIAHDQLFYMAQCGITSFEIMDQHHLTEALTAFDDFSESYQTTVLKPTPLYRHR